MELRMRLSLVVLLMCVVTVGQVPAPKYQPATIMAVMAHQSPGKDEDNPTQYDVSVRVGETTYLVLFTPVNGSNTVKYALGDEALVLVGSNTLSFNSPAAGAVELPILSREAKPAQILDVSRACGQYSTVKMQHLSENLSLTDNQRSEIMPTLQQEAGEVSEICFNAVLSPEDKLNRYEKILRLSDEKLRPLLTTAQLQKLQQLRKEQKKDLKKMIADQKSVKQN
jgi:hypothetical protein